MFYEQDTIEWDDKKRQLVMSRRNLDIVVDALAVLSDEKAITFASSRKSETRYKTTGMLNGKLYTVIHTPRNNKCRVITMRRAHKSEERTYYDN